ncbi:hypothetical protein BKA56DRAFT_694318 [Ilyonectria sp. MPI-CAGE-AT-0026]|nr:hypothetical protein BKA56DRAFT_694318 [Ilyonectria sp. MPI-CAGE-AT-0026]
MPTVDQLIRSNAATCNEMLGKIKTASLNGPLNADASVVSGILHVAMKTCCDHTHFPRNDVCIGDLRSEPVLTGISTRATGGNASMASRCILDGVHNLVAGQVGQGGLLQPAGDLTSKEGINRTERQGKDDKGGYTPSQLPGASAVNNTASVFVDGGKSVSTKSADGVKGAGNYCQEDPDYLLDMNLKPQHEGMHMWRSQNVYVEFSFDHGC